MSDERYGWRHAQARREALKWAKPTDKCPRCRLPLGPELLTNPAAFDLDHVDGGGPSDYNVTPDSPTGTAHRRCNRRVGGRRGGQVTARGRGYAAEDPGRYVDGRDTGGAGYEPVWDW